MFSNFDIHNRYEIPKLMLCNPNRQELAFLGFAKEIKISLRFNALSDLSFKVYRGNRNSEEEKNYKLIVKNRLIKVDNFGWFVIQFVDETNDGLGTYKQVECFSYEYTLNAHRINLLDGTFKFYDVFNNEDTLMGKIISELPNWHIGNIDSSLWNKYRTFEIPNNTIYTFLMSTVAEAYECIFTFDINTLSINAQSPKNLIKKTDITMSYNNLIKKLSISETNDDIVTVMNVSGGGDMDVSSVNPMGTPVIYNFDYFTNLEWMSKELISALNNWKLKFNSAQIQYGNYLVLYKNYNLELIVLNGNLKDLNSELESFKGVQTAQISQGLSIVEISEKIAQKESQIRAKQLEIKNKNNQINDVNKNLDSISQSLQFKNNFSEPLLRELNNFVFTGSYQNENFIITDVMTPVDIQSMALELYQQGMNALVKLSQPRYTFSMDTMNFLFIKEYMPFIEQLELGALINVEVEKNIWIEPVLLEVEIDFDKPDNLNMTFGNRFRLDTSEWTFGDLYTDTSSTSNDVRINANIWSKPVKSGFFDEVSGFINSTLDASKNAVINADNQEIIIDRYGFTGREMTSEGYYKPEQIKIIKDQIVFTDNNWQSAKLALGRIKIPNTNNFAYGLNAEIIAGRLVASNQLYITNENSHFIVDGSGLAAVNASFTSTNLNNTKRIIMNPDVGISVEGRNSVADNWSKKIFLDDKGNATFDGKIIARSGSVGGFNIEDSILRGNKVGLSGNELNKWAFWAGNNNPDIAPFRVNHNGDLFANNAYLTGIIRAKAGSSIGSWQIEENSLRSSEDWDNCMTLASSEYIGYISWKQNGQNLGSISTDYVGLQVSAPKSLSLLIDGGRAGISMINFNSYNRLDIGCGDEVGISMYRNLVSIVGNVMVTGTLNGSNINEFTLKKDLTIYATQIDLLSYTTKTDLFSYVTKTDLSTELYQYARAGLRQVSVSGFVPKDGGDVTLSGWITI